MPRPSVSEDPPPSSPHPSSASSPRLVTRSFPSLGHEFGSIDGIVNGLYQSISFERGGQPDWELFKSLFAPSARLSKVGMNLEPIVYDVEGFMDHIEHQIGSGGLAGFAERELARRTDVFGGIAQVFSTFDRQAGEGEHVRGINTLQLQNDGVRWWVFSILWTEETPDQQLPATYLPKKKRRH